MNNTVTIPTAKQLLFNILSEVKCDSIIDYLEDDEDGKELLVELIEEINIRTRMHVKFALAAALRNSEVHENDRETEAAFIESILNAYPDTNII
jgi:predicted translin family RNA/ssDNA-binding protein